MTKSDEQQPPMTQFLGLATSVSSGSLTRQGDGNKPKLYSVVFSEIQNFLDQGPVNTVYMTPIPWPAIENLRLSTFNTHQNCTSLFKIAQEM